MDRHNCSMVESHGIEKRLGRAVTIFHSVDLVDLIDKITGISISDPVCQSQVSPWYTRKVSGLITKDINCALTHTLDEVIPRRGGARIAQY